MWLISLVFLPFLVAILFCIIGQRRILRNGLLMGISIYNFFIILMLSPDVLKGELFSVTLLKLPFFNLAFQLDALSLLIGALITFLWIFTSSYSIGYMAEEQAQTRYFTALTVCLGATMGIILSKNLISLFMFYELLGLAVYPLVIHIETEEALRAGVVYLVYLLVGGAALLLAIIFTYSLTGGDLNFSAGGIPGLAQIHPWLLYILFFLFLVGFGVKGALMPLHIWLPRAMIAPTPVSALLHAVAVVNMGLYGFIRMIYNVFGPSLFHCLHLDLILAIPAAITIIGGAIAALQVEKIKHLLAYSTINQLSYVILGASSVHPMALMGALIHLVYHSIMKITLFYSAGTIIKQTHKEQIKQMAGLARKMPISCAAFAIGSVGLLGLPPIAGWISKWYLIEGFLYINRPWTASIFIISTVIEIGYFSPPLIYAYFWHNHADSEQYGLKQGTKFEAPLDMIIPLVVVAILSLSFGLFGGLPFKFGKATVNILIPGAAW
jgi:multicomponent Na+:H+ antiporter subunit D